MAPYRRLCYTHNNTKMISLLATKSYFCETVRLLATKIRIRANLFFIPTKMSEAEYRQILESLSREELIERCIQQEKSIHYLKDKSDKALDGMLDQTILALNEQIRYGFVF